MVIYWSAEEVEFLKRSYGKMPTADIASALGRTLSAVSCYAKFLGIRFYPSAQNDSRRGMLWTTEEDQLLRDIYGNKAIADVADEFGRSRIAIRNRAIRLGLSFAPVKGRPSRERYETILREECKKDRIPIAVALSKSRRRPEVYARFRTWAHLKDLGFSFPGIGAVAGFDHTSIMNGTRALARLMGSR